VLRVLKNALRRFVRKELVDAEQRWYGYKFSIAPEGEAELEGRIASIAKSVDGARRVLHAGGNSGGSAPSAHASVLVPLVASIAIVPSVAEELWRQLDAWSTVIWPFVAVALISGLWLTRFPRPPPGEDFLPDDDPLLPSLRELRSAWAAATVRAWAGLQVAARRARSWSVRVWDGVAALVRRSLGGLVPESDVVEQPRQRTSERSFPLFDAVQLHHLLRRRADIPRSPDQPEFAAAHVNVKVLRLSGRVDGWARSGDWTAVLHGRDRPTLSLLHIRQRWWGRDRLERKLLRNHVGDFLLDGPWLLYTTVSAENRRWLQRVRLGDRGEVTEAPPVAAAAGSRALQGEEGGWLIGASADGHWLALSNGTVIDLVSGESFDRHTALAGSGFASFSSTGRWMHTANGVFRVRTGAKVDLPTLSGRSRWLKVESLAVDPDRARSLVVNVALFDQPRVKALVERWKPPEDEHLAPFHLFALLAREAARYYHVTGGSDQLAAREVQVLAIVDQAMGLADAVVQGAPSTTPGPDFDPALEQHLKKVVGRAMAAGPLNADTITQLAATLDREREREAALADADRNRPPPPRRAGRLQRLARFAGGSGPGTAGGPLARGRLTDRERQALGEWIVQKADVLSHTDAVRIYVGGEAGAIHPSLEHNDSDHAVIRAGWGFVEDGLGNKRDGIKLDAREIEHLRQVLQYYSWPTAPPDRPNDMGLLTLALTDAIDEAVELMNGDEHRPQGYLDRSWLAGVLGPGGHEHRYRAGARTPSSLADELVDSRARIAELDLASLRRDLVRAMSHLAHEPSSADAQALVARAVEDALASYLERVELNLGPAAAGADSWLLTREVMAVLRDAGMLALVRPGLELARRAGHERLELALATLEQRFPSQLDHRRLDRLIGDQSLNRLAQALEESWRDGRLSFLGAPRVGRPVLRLPGLVERARAAIVEPWVLVDRELALLWRVPEQVAEELARQAADHGWAQAEATLLLVIDEGQAQALEPTDPGQVFPDWLHALHPIKVPAEPSAGPAASPADPLEPLLEEIRASVRAGDLARKDANKALKDAQAEPDLPRKRQLMATAKEKHLTALLAYSRARELTSRLPPGRAAREGEEAIPKRIKELEREILRRGDSSGHVVSLVIGFAISAVLLRWLFGEMESARQAMDLALVLVGTGAGVGSRASAGSGTTPGPGAPASASSGAGSPIGAGVAPSSGVGALGGQQAVPTQGSAPLSAPTVPEFTSLPPPVGGGPPPVPPTGGIPTPQAPAPGPMPAPPALTVTPLPLPSDEEDADRGPRREPAVGNRLETTLVVAVAVLRRARRLLRSSRRALPASARAGALGASEDGNRVRRRYLQRAIRRAESRARSAKSVARHARRLLARLATRRPAGAGALRALRLAATISRRALTLARRARRRYRRIFVGQRHRRAGAGSRRLANRRLANRQRDNASYRVFVAAPSAVATAAINPDLAESTRSAALRPHSPIELRVGPAAGTVSAATVLSRLAPDPESHAPRSGGQLRKLIGALPLQGPRALWLFWQPGDRRLVDLRTLAVQEGPRDDNHGGSWFAHIVPRLALVLFALLFLLGLLLALHTLLRRSWTPATGAGDVSRQVPPQVPLSNASDFTDDRMLLPVARAGRGGEVGAAVRTAIGRLGSPSTRAAHRENELIAELRVAPASFTRVGVISGERGAGVSTTAVMVAELLGRHHGDWVAVVDPSATSGPLAAGVERYHPSPLAELVDERHVPESAGQIHAFLGGPRAVGNPTTSDAYDDADRSAWRDALDLLAIDRSIVVIDLGVVGPGPAGRSLLDLCDQLVLLVGNGPRSPAAATALLDRLEQRGHRELAQRAVVAVSNVPRFTRPHVEAAGWELDERLRAPIAIKHDHRLSHGESNPDALTAATRRGYLELAANLIRGAPR